MGRGHHCHHPENLCPLLLPLLQSLGPKCTCQGMLPPLTLCLSCCPDTCLQNTLGPSLPLHKCHFVNGRTLTSLSQPATDTPTLAHPKPLCASTLPCHLPAKDRNGFPIYYAYHVLPVSFWQNTAPRVGESFFFFPTTHGPKTEPGTDSELCIFWNSNPAGTQYLWTTGNCQTALHTSAVVNLACLPESDGELRLWPSWKLRFNEVPPSLGH